VLENRDRTMLLHIILAGASTAWGPGPGGVVPSPSLWKPFTQLLMATGKRRLHPPGVGEFPVRQP
jgi:hypothetical protein